MKQIMVQPENCLGCKSCEIACAVAHSESKTLFSSVMEPEPPVNRVFVETNGLANFPFQCRQCSDTPCVHACMTGAMHIDTVTGLTQIDTEKCVGCWMCVMVCPFGAVTQKFSAHKAEKCDRCQELDYNPACVEACPTKALRFTEVSEFAQSGRKAYVSQMMKGVK